MGLEDQIVRGEAGKEHPGEVDERAEGEDAPEPAFFAHGEDHAASQIEPAGERAEYEGGDDRRSKDHQQAVDIGRGDIRLADLPNEQPDQEDGQHPRAAQDRGAEVAEQAGDSGEEHDDRDRVGGRIDVRLGVVVARRQEADRVEDDAELAIVVIAGRIERLALDREDQILVGQRWAMELEGIVAEDRIDREPGDLAPIGQHADRDRFVGKRPAVTHPECGIPGAVPRCAGHDDLAHAAEPAEIGPVSLFLRVAAAQIETIVPLANVDPVRGLELVGDEQRGQGEDQDQEHRRGADRAPGWDERLHDPAAERCRKIGERIAPPDDAAALRGAHSIR